MPANVVPSYRWLRRISSLEGLPRFIEKILPCLRRALSRLQSVGEVFDLLVLKFLDWVGRHAVGRELTEPEKARLMFFIHKVVLAFLVIGYLVGCLTGH